VHRVSRVGYTDVMLDESGRRYWRTALGYYIGQQGASVTDRRAAGADNELRIRDVSWLEARDHKDRFVVPGYAWWDEDVFYHGPRSMGLSVAGDGLDVWCGHRRTDFSLSFLMQANLAAHGGSLVHAAAVSTGDGAILLPGFGGVGKTAFVSAALARAGVRLLGDDLVSLDASGRVHPYLRPMAIYPHHREIFPDFFAHRRLYYARLPILPVKAAVRLLNQVALRIDWPHVPVPSGVAQAGYVRVRPEALFSEEQLDRTTQRVHQVFVIQRSAQGAHVEVNAIAKDEAVAFMSAVIRHEVSWYDRVLFGWLAARGTSPSSYFEAVEAAIRRALDSSKSIKCVSLPAGLSIGDVGQRLADIVFG
jgi:hypothetical protein